MSSTDTAGPQGTPMWISDAGVGFAAAAAAAVGEWDVLPPFVGACDVTSLVWVRFLHVAGLSVGAFLPHGYNSATEDKCTLPT